MSDDGLVRSLRFSTAQRFQARVPKRVAVAVSGGGDSMACLDLMRHHAGTFGFQLSAVTVDHGLRPEAKDEIALVAAYCAEHDIPHAVLEWSWDGSGNLQAAARDARYRLIASWARSQKVRRILLGHSETDVAETFLMRLARKPGVDGLAMMEREFERHGVRWDRPLLDVSRADLRKYLVVQGVDWAEDPSNEDDRFDRVKARKALATLAPLGIDEAALAAVAQNLFFAKAALDHYLVDTAWRFVDEIDGDLVLPCSIVDEDRQIPFETLFRLRGEALRWIGGASYAPRSAGMIEMDVALQKAKTHTLGGCLITRLEGKRVGDRRWRITREYNAVKDTVTPTTELWDGRWKLDGSHQKSLEIRALGEAVTDTPWRETGMPRASLLASPAVWRGDTLVAAPVAGLANGWTAKATGRGNFSEFLLSR